MPSIAVVGTEGSGKTVLVTMLAKQFARVGDKGLALSPANRATASYVERNWATLQDQEWPASTTPGDLINLCWTLWDDDDCYEFRVADCAGQDLRLLFSEERINSLAELPAELQAVAAQVRSADVVLLLANLRDSIGESNPERRLANEWVVRGALDSITGRTPAPKCAVVFTQIDQFEAVLQKHGSWKQVAREFLPHVYDAYLASGKVELLSVSAIGRTTTVADERGAARRVPDWSREIDNSSLESLIRWIASAAKTAPSVTNPDPTNSSDRWDPETGKDPLSLLKRMLDFCDSRRGTVLLLSIGATALMILWQCAGGFYATNKNGSSKTSETVVPPKPELPIPLALSTQVDGRDGLANDTVIGRVHVINNGAVGPITVHIYFHELGSEFARDQRTLILAKGEVQLFEFSKQVPTVDWRNTEVKYTVEVAK